MPNRLRTILLMGCCLMVLCHLPQAAFGQGFVNLDFESANVSGFSTGNVPITNALPGWNAYIGESQIDVVLYNTATIGGAGVSLQGPGSPLPYVIAGNYSVLLQGNSLFPVSAAIAQI